jgi:hypothetical protein
MSRRCCAACARGALPQFVNRLPVSLRMHRVPATAGGVLGPRGALAVAASGSGSGGRGREDSASTAEGLSGEEDDLEGASDHSDDDGRDEHMRQEARQMLLRLSNVMPFLMLFLLKYLYQHAVGIVFALAYTALIIYLDRKFKAQVAMKVSHGSNPPQISLSYSVYCAL